MNTENDQKSEVGVTPDDNNDHKLPGSVQANPTMGAGEYNFAQSTPLDPADTAGVIYVPSMGLGYGMPSMNANVDITNSDTTLMATASTENLSKKYKYPQVSQDIPAKGKPSVTFNDHS